MTGFREMTGQINEITTGFVRSQVLMTANALNVFAALEEPRPAEDVAQACATNPRGTRMLLDGLVALDLVTKSEGRYCNTPLASACLVPGGPAYQGHIIRHNQHGWATWAQLDEAVKTGAGVPKEGSERSPEELRDFILGMQDIAQLSAQEVLGALDLAPYKHLLDLGGGPATYATACLAAYPGMRATLFDRPDVIAIAREQVDPTDFAGRIDYLPGDMTTDDIGSGYDLILISNIIHSFGPEQNRAIVKKCFDALEPAGRLIIKDFLVENDRSGPPFSLLFALRMLVHSGVGDTYTFAELAEWTRDAGFTDGHAVSLTPQTRLWIVDRP